VNVGDRVRVVSVPPNLPEDSQLQTRSLFERCVGKVFVIVSTKRQPGMTHDLIELEVGALTGLEPAMESIWIESEHLTPAD
jgi:hypothetical protein